MAPADVLLFLMRPRDSSSLGIFRVAFGCLAAWHVQKLLFGGVLRSELLDPPLLFKYPGFGWVHPPEANLLLLLLLLLLANAFLIAVGIFARISALIFFLGFTYLFLLDRSAYQNHTYLICLVSLILAVVPTDGSYSVASLFSGSREPVRNWHLLLLRFQLGVPYVFGGIAKLNGDWLLEGQPMRLWLDDRYPSAEWNVALAYGLSWGGAVFDLLIVPALCWRRTRLAAFSVAALFHLVNSQVFSIGIFPLFMICANTVFFGPDWPRRLLRAPTGAPLPAEPGAANAGLVPALFLYLALQVLVPLRGYFYAGNTSWTEEGHDFAWRMKLRDKRGSVVFRVSDPQLGRDVMVTTRKLLTPRQHSSVVHDPECIRQLSHYLASTYPGRPAVRAVTRISLNGRRQRPLVDPMVDLARQPWSWRPAPWITRNE